MAAPDPFSLDDFAAIPDPARGVAARPAPALPPPGDPSPTRAERRRRNLLAAGFGLAWVVFLVAHLGVRGNIGDAGLLASLGLWTLLAVGGLALALRTNARGLPPSLRVVQIVLLAGAALYVVAVLVRDAAAPNVPIRWSNVIGCLSWAHLLAAGPLLVAALIFRRSFLAFPAWRGNLFVGGLKDKQLVRLVIENDRVTGEEHLLADRGQRVRDVRQGPDGALYAVTDEAKGELWKIVPRR